MTRKEELEKRINEIHDLSLWGYLTPEETKELSDIEKEYHQIIAVEVSLMTGGTR